MKTLLKVALFFTFILSKGNTWAYQWPQNLADINTVDQALVEKTLGNYPEELPELDEFRKQSSRKIINKKSIVFYSAKGPLQKCFDGSFKRSETKLFLYITGQQLMRSTVFVTLC